MRKIFLATAGVWLSAGPASAFYFPDWPGAAVKTPPILIPPDVPPEGNPPSAVSPPNDGPPYLEETDPPPGGHAPEPATLALAAVGLAAVAIGRRARRPARGL